MSAVVQLQQHESELWRASRLNSIKNPEHRAVVDLLEAKVDTLDERITEQHLTIAASLGRIEGTVQAVREEGRTVTERFDRHLTNHVANVTKPWHSWRWLVGMALLLLSAGACVRLIGPDLAAAITKMFTH